MRHLIARFVLIMLLAGSSSIASAQSFYVHAFAQLPEVNKFYVMNVQDRSIMTPMPFCQPTSDTFVYPAKRFTDMAVDKEGAIWYVSTYGQLYKQGVHDTACKFMGNFPGGNINALVADVDGNIYGAGNVGSACNLYMYNEDKGFSTVGNLPDGTVSAGDLFFFRNRLFLTCSNPTLISAYLLEVTLPNPSLSCTFMQLKGMQPWAAFSLADSAGNPAVYLLNVVSIATPKAYTQLISVDMVNRTITDTVGTYPFEIGGAAAWYDGTGARRYCTDSTSTTGIRNTAVAGQQYFRILNPSRDVIRIQTNLTATDIADISLFDVCGKRVQHYDAGSITTGMDASYLNSGLYLMRLTTNTGRVYAQKLVKE